MTDISVAPARFTQDAKAKWKDTPEILRAEIHRVHDELLDEYRSTKAKALRHKQMEPFEEMASAQGLELRDVIQSYVNMERLLQTDLIAGINVILERMGLTPQMLAEMVIGPERFEAYQRKEAEIIYLRGKKAALEEQLARSA